MGRLEDREIGNWKIEKLFKMERLNTYKFFNDILVKQIVWISC